MAPWAACLRERRRTYEGCRDLHQTRSVLAAVSGGGRGLREREPPSLGPMQEDLRICFETPEDGQEPRGNHASEAPHIASQNIVVRCNMAHPTNGVKNRTGNFRRASTRSNSPTSRASIGCSSTSNDGAAVCIAASWPMPATVGSRSTATRKIGVIAPFLDCLAVIS